MDLRTADGRIGVNCEARAKPFLVAHAPTRGLGPAIPCCAPSGGYGAERESCEDEEPEICLFFRAFCAQHDLFGKPFDPYQKGLHRVIELSFLTLKLFKQRVRLVRLPLVKQREDLVGEAVDILVFLRDIP